MESKRHLVAALERLGIDRLVLAIHDQSFPSLPEEETGRGTPYSAGAARFCEFLSGLGFNAIQLGPQGKTSLANPSPYDSTLFSKNELSISLYALANDPAWCGLLSQQHVADYASESPSQHDRRTRRSYQYAWHTCHAALKIAYNNFVARKQELQPLWLSFMVWSSENSDWLTRDSLFEACAIENQTDDWRQWADTDLALCASPTPDEEQSKRIEELRAKYKQEFEYYNFCQFVAHKQHQDFRTHVHNLHLKLFADLQIGYSQRDIWALSHLFLPNYLLGAPPSRTNPDGQPWGYTVLNPDLYYDFDEGGRLITGSALRFMNARVDKLLLDFDGIRIDHPHGLVCPWVYKSAEPDALRAVQQGARLFDSPEVPGHEDLARFAIARASQLDHNVPRYADGWVKELEQGQVEQYGLLIQTIKERMAQKGLNETDMICEVLSSCPYPLKRVLDLNGLGRFRVTQKAKPTDPKDVYRSDNATANDWIMVGTHDTRPIWAVVDNWDASERDAWAEYLSHRLEPDAAQRGKLKAELATSKLRLIEAMFADLFVGPARNVSVFFADLLGMTETYNEPGVVNDTNWTLSVPNNYEQVYAQRVARGEAFNLPRILAMALHGKFGDEPAVKELVAELDKLATAFAVA